MNQEETDTLNGCCGVFCLVVAIAVCVVSFLAIENHLWLGLMLLFVAAIIGAISIAFLINGYLEKKDMRQSSKETLNEGEMWDILYLQTHLSKLQEGIKLPMKGGNDYQTFIEACARDQTMRRLLQLEPTDISERRVWLVRVEIRRLEIWQEISADD